MSVRIVRQDFRRCRKKNKIKVGYKARVSVMQFQQVDCNCLKTKRQAAFCESERHLTVLIKSITFKNLHPLYYCAA